MCSLTPVTPLVMRVVFQTATDEIYAGFSVSGKLETCVLMDFVSYILHARKEALTVFRLQAPTELKKGSHKSLCMYYTEDVVSTHS